MAGKARIWLTFFAALAAAPACTKCGSEKAGEKAAATFEDDGTRVNKTLGLITPEQFVGNVQATLAYDNSWVIQDIMRNKAVALGGIDYRGAQHRNRVPTGQSALTIRNLAWLIASEVVDRDAFAQVQGQDPKTFTSCNVGLDRPIAEADFRLPPEVQMALQEGDKRYRTQLEEIYWRLLSRPPSDDEKATMTTLFTTVAGAEGDARQGWKAVLYVLLASMEYWNI